MTIIHSSRDLVRRIAPISIGGAIAVITISVLVARSLVTINPGEVGLIIRLGKLQDEVLQEGTHLILPISTEVKTMGVRLQKTELESTARTKDLQRINAKVVLTWRLEPKNLKTLYEQIGSAEELMDKVIIPNLDETVKANIPARSLTAIFGDRELLKEEVLSKIRGRLAPYGIIVQDIAFVNLTASEEFTKATEARQIAEQQAITAKLVAEQAIREAELKAIKAKKEAEAVVNSAKGQAQAQQLLQQTLTPEILRKQAIEKWDGRFPVVMGGDGTLPLVNLSLPNAQAENPPKK